MHSGTGRVNRITMLPMSLYESKESNGKISILDLFKNPDINIDGIESDLTIENLAFATCRGGWSESVIQTDKETQLFVAENYVTIFANQTYLPWMELKEIQTEPKKY